MPKTASDLTPEAIQQYDLTRNRHKGLDPECWERAQVMLPKLAALLREEFGATRIQLFGLLWKSPTFKRASSALPLKH